LPQSNWEPSLGAIHLEESRCRFRVWAPRADRVEVNLCGSRLVPLEPREHGWFEATVEGVEPGTRYLYRLDGGEERPDPASRFQPDGVHGRSMVVDRRFGWSDQGWQGVPLEDVILYELHVGTFTPEGTFDAVIPHLDRLADLGVTAVELMPVAQFPGRRNWGYDGVFPYAVQESYGGPEGLKRLVDAAHARGLAVVLDVVYNHLGPEGNYLGDFGPYFTARYKTPGGSPSTSTARSATRSATTSSRTPCSGSPTSTSTVCGWTPSTPSPTPRSARSSRSWGRR
jgi:maltooligosyltrehalose trehalohydrolase